MRIILYADATVAASAGATPAKATAQIVIEFEDRIDWAQVTIAREHLRSTIGEVLTEVAAYRSSIV